LPVLLRGRRTARIGYLCAIEPFALCFPLSIDVL
jgi:hypothetical protein